MQRSLLSILATALLAIAGYAAFVQLVPVTITTGQNQGDTNMIRAQDYLSAQDRVKLVLAGSSLTFRLPPSELGSETANLAFAGGGSLTGLEVVEEAGASPKLVMVEVNSLARELDRDFVRALVRFPDRQLRAHVRAFRTGYDPVNLAWHGMAALLHKEDSPPVPPANVVRQLTEVQRQDLSRAPDIARLRRNLAVMKELVQSLQARGIRVGFFAMPVDAGLENLPGEAVPRQLAVGAFPRDRFCWIDLAVAGGTHTVDGIHLTPEDATLVANQIGRQKDGCLSRTAPPAAGPGLTAPGGMPRN